MIGRSLDDRSPITATAARRDLVIDATRGASMLFVFLSHFGFALVEPWSGVPDPVGDRLTILGMIASPAFMLVSGLTVATLASDAVRFEALRGKLIDRGLFTVVVGHVLIGVADGTLLAGSPLHQNLAITDVVGLATVLAALTRVRWSARASFMGAAALFAVSWLLFALVWPTQVAGSWLFGVLVGSHRTDIAERGFPLLPWLGVYFVGLGLGKLRRGWPAALVARRLALLGAGSVALGVAGWLARRLMTRATSWPAFGSLAYRFLSPLEKYPPGAVYLLAFGGAAIGVFALVEWLAHATRSPIPALLAPMGRASLFTFIAQALVIQRLLPALGPDMRHTWPLWYAGISLLLWTAAWWWQRQDLNRLFTLGLARLQFGPSRPASRDRIAS